MAHQIEIKGGKAKMAYANEVPWHRLGTKMNGLQTAEAMLAAAEADFDVALTSVAAIDAEGNFIRNPDGSPVIISDSRATVRCNPDGTFDGLSTVGTRFVVQQNRECLNRALDVVGASKGDAVVDTCGVLDEGREFFACLDLGGLIIDPTGINDKIERYMLVRNGHDGRTPITYANTSIRAVCKNTVMAGLSAARSTFTARHTRNADSAIEDAQTVLNLSTEWASAFKANAEALLAINVPQSSQRLTKIIEGTFPERNGESQRQKENREEIHTVIRSLFLNEKNAGGFGFNGWSAYNTVVEYLDHYRDAKPEERAIASMDYNSWVTRKKATAQEIILSLV
jgi:phage/plasmid-like protein (TIGR03299 family)